MAFMRTVRHITRISSFVSVSDLCHIYHLSVSESVTSFVSTHFKLNASHRLLVVFKSITVDKSFSNLLTCWLMFDCSMKSSYHYVILVNLDYTNLIYFISESKKKHNFHNSSTSSKFNISRS